MIVQQMKMITFKEFDYFDYIVLQHDIQSSKCQFQCIDWLKLLMSHEKIVKNIELSEKKGWSELKEEMKRA